MTGYTKLFGSIIASTIWRESSETKVVWITMLAMANKTGVVEASIPGLADLARVSIDDAKRAVETLSSPDEYSRTRDHEGRRIEPVDGGWMILNHAKYRQKLSADERREYNAEAKRRSRKRSTDVSACPQMSAMSAQAEADTKSNSKSKNAKEGARSCEISPVSPSSPKPPDESLLVQNWFFHKVGQGGRCSVDDVAAVLDDLKSRGFTDAELLDAMKPPFRRPGEFPDAWSRRLIADREKRQTSGRPSDDAMARYESNIAAMRAAADEKFERIHGTGAK
jgi:hypothetical protein